MTYPSGDIIEIGDLIWINGGTQQAIVSEVIEGHHQLASWGLTDSGIFVALSRPSTSSPTRDLFIAQRFFEDEGIGPVANQEPQML